MKKIAVITNVFRECEFGSGGERVFYEFIKKLIDTGNEVDLYCTKHLNPNEKRHLKLNKLIEIGHPKDYKRAKKIENTIKKYKELIDQGEYDEVYNENFTPPIDKMFIQGHSALRVLEIQENFFQRFLFFINKFDHIFAQKKWLSSKNISEIIVPSYFLKNELIKNFNLREDIFKIIRPGLDIKNNVKDKDFSNLILGLSAPSFTKKGGFIFLKALRELKRNNIKFKARIIYPKWKKNLLVLFYLKLWKLEDAVEFLPAQKNMEEFYNSINVIVVPSLVESFAMLLTEGMNYKNIPIVSDVAGAAEIIEDGKNGFIFKMNKKAHMNLYKSILNLLQANKEEISKQAKITANNLSWERVFDKL